MSYSGDKLKVCGSGLFDVLLLIRRRLDFVLESAGFVYAAYAGFGMVDDDDAIFMDSKGK